MSSKNKLNACGALLFAFFLCITSQICLRSVCKVCCRFWRFGHSTKLCHTCHHLPSGYGSLSCHPACTKWPHSRHLSPPASSARSSGRCPLHNCNIGKVVIGVHPSMVFLHGSIVCPFCSSTLSNMFSLFGVSSSCFLALRCDLCAVPPASVVATCVLSLRLMSDLMSSS